MMKKWIVILILIVMSSSFYGCVSQDKNGRWHIALTQQAAESIENIGETTTSILSLLSVFVPGLAAAAGIAGGATATYKKMKPSLTKNKAVSKHVVTSLETLKKQQPELWAKVKDYMKENSNADIDVAIREIVNLIKKAEETNGKTV